MTTDTKSATVSRKSGAKAGRTRREFDAAGDSDAARDTDLARLFAALGDVTRLRILQGICLQDLSPDALALRLGISGNLLAHHLRTLQEAGLIARLHSQHDRRRTYIQSTAGRWPWLADLVQDGGVLRTPRVLFVCTHNSARSVLAEALWRQLSPVPCASAGTRPAARVNPRARRAARTLGLPMRALGPQSLDEVMRADDLLVSVCDAVNEELPAAPNHRLHWSIPDPSAVDTDAAFVEASGLLRQRVERLVPRVASAKPNTPTSPNEETA